MTVMAAEQYGIWSDLAGGLIDDRLSKAQADKERGRLIAQDGEDPDDLKVIELCPDHEEQPKDGCEECDAEPGEEDDECDED